MPQCIVSGYRNEKLHCNVFTVWIMNEPRLLYDTSTKSLFFYTISSDVVAYVGYWIIIELDNSTPRGYLVLVQLLLEYECDYDWV